MKVFVQNHMKSNKEIINSIYNNQLSDVLSVPSSPG